MLLKLIIYFNKLLIYGIKNEMKKQFKILDKINELD